MALKAVHVSDVPTLDQVPAAPAVALSSSLTRLFKDDPFCTLQDAFQGVDSHLGFNIELKFDDHVIYREEQLAHALRVVLEFAKERPIVFSSFQPDAARLMRGLQNVYPVSSVPSHRGFGACYLISQVPTQVFFLTNGGTEIYRDARRNSLDEAIKLCTASGLQGIVSEVRAFFRNPAAVARIKESNLALLTYGQLNNVPKAVYMQQLLGVNGVIVDLVKEITEALRPHPMQLK
ncbi:hypothetical protein BHM03_00031183 [Ensete ventricosum]|uniref:glycerophosphodiester phosphodiesterase n=1 Tax=Ensete ventricosum TaxID=4639 RepID=A0A426YLX3_ENSVE|nr:hypothetical protein B296_00039269 [Ensete ventricosum]RZS01339.1 hypothetical protein BHM03_00031183 [Ensete ventricosum]